MMETTELDRKLRARLLLGRRVEGDRLMLGDGVLRAALDGSRPLTPGERAALQESPLTLRRLRHLADERRARARAWRGSAGLLRAADGGAALQALATDDGMWRLHFVGEGQACQVILQLAPQAAGAHAVLAQRPALRVTDGAGAVVLEGRLDGDGECEGRWPFASAPAQHFQRHGAGFKVEPCKEG
ncbi:hypothetical protein [Massilia niastensis]|uniref:hypothetical protein n=1 Tax=Massilia niastensis TaxID=544911 RepID=UPI0003726D72|nr:hypothetical protein [Massilia niastensis]